MSRFSLPSLAVAALLSLSSPALAQAPSVDSTHAGELTSLMLDQAVVQARLTPPAAPPEPVVHEAPTPTAEVALSEVVHLLVRAFTTKSWGLLACSVVLGAVWAVRRFLSARVQWLRSDVAGVVLSMATAVSLSLVTALQAGTPVTLSLVLGAFLTAAGASGLFSWGKTVSAATKARQGTRIAATH